MKKAILCVVLLSSSLALLCVAAMAQDEHPIMRPDNETRRQWMEEDLSLPKTYLDPAIKPKRGSKSLLGYLPYTPAERQQGNCGDCWAWAGTGCAEIANRMQGGVSNRLSIQYINSCGSNSSGRYSCCGGNLFRFAEWYGARGMFVPWSNASAAFADASSTCSLGASPVSCGMISTSPHYPINSIAASTIETYGVGQATAIANIKNALNQNKAVYFGFWLPDKASWDAFYDFWNNRDETMWFNFSDYSGRPYTSDGGGHAVLIVGYNDDDPSHPYWIVVNSWGTANGMRPNGVFLASMDIDYDAYVDSPSQDNAMLLFQTLDVGIGSQTVSSAVRVFADRTSFSASYDEMYIYASADSISTPFYPFVRVVTPYYGTYYLTSNYVMYPYPMPYTPYPITTGGISNLFLCGLWWQNLGTGTYYLEGGGVNAAQPVTSSGFNYISPVARNAFTLN